MSDSNYSTGDAAQALAKATETVCALGEALRNCGPLLLKSSADVKVIEFGGNVSGRALLVERCDAHKNSEEIDDTCHECEALFDASTGKCLCCGEAGASPCPGCGERYCQRCAERPYEFCACSDEPKESEPK